MTLNRNCIDDDNRKQRNCILSKLLKYKTDIQTEQQHLLTFQFYSNLIL